MKKIFYLMLCLSLLLIVSSCNDDDINNLQSQIDELKSDQISTLRQQIVSIQNSITNLKQVDEGLNAYIITLQQEAEELKKAIEENDNKITELKEELSSKIDIEKSNLLAQIEALKSSMVKRLELLTNTITSLENKDIELSKRIEALQSYIDSEITSTKNWADATFATLKQLEETNSQISSIKSEIQSLNTSIETLEKNISTKITEEINKAVEDIIKQDIDITINSKIEEITKNYSQAIANVKEEITKAYKTEISTAITASEISLKSWVNEQLTGYSKISDTESKIQSLKAEIDEKITNVQTYLENMITNLQKTLSQDISANTNLINNLKDKIGTLEIKISENAQKILNNSTAINENSNKISENSINIKKNSDEIKNLEADINKISQLIEQNKQLILENNALILSNSTLISENKNSIAIIKSSTETNAQNIAKNALDIITNAQNIANNSQLINDNAVAISNNTSAINENKIAIEKLKTDIEKNKNEITNSYKEAISAAIIESEGKLTSTIQASINAINSEIDSKIRIINTRLETIESKISIIEKEIKNIKDSISSIRTDLDNIQQEINTILDQIQAIGTTIETLKETDKGLDAYIKTLQEEAARLKASINSNDIKIDNIKKELSDSLSKEKANLIAQIEALRNSMNSKYETIQSTINTLQQKDKELEDRISTLKSYINEQINNTQNWVSATFATLQQMQETNAEISAIKTQIISMNTTLETLENNLTTKVKEEIDKAIDGALKDGVANQIKSQIDEITTAYTQAISTAKQELTQLFEEKLSTAITTSENSLKEWVNNQLTGYAKIDETNSKISDLKSILENQINSSKTYLETLITNLKKLHGDELIKQKEFIDSLDIELKKLNNTVSRNKNLLIKLESDLASTKDEITQSYKNAISKAITDLEGKINITIQEKIVEINSNIDTKVSTINNELTSLKERISNIETDIQTLKESISGLQNDIDKIKQQITDIMSRIQSIVNIPEYSDGSVGMSLTQNLDGTITPGTATLSFEVSPETAAAQLTQVWEQALDVKAVYTISRSTSLIEMPIKNVIASNGILSVTISGENLKKDFFDGKISANARLKISDGKNIRTSEYINIIPLTRDIVIGNKKFNIGYKGGTIQVKTDAKEEFKIDINATWITLPSPTPTENYLKFEIEENKENKQREGTIIFTSTDGSVKQTVTVTQDFNNETSNNLVVEDPAFMTYLLNNFDMNHNGELSQEEVNLIAEIDVSNLQIYSLKGINQIPNLRKLTGNSIHISELDCSNLKYLHTITCQEIQDPQLETINLSNCPNLKTINFEREKWNGGMTYSYWIDVKYANISNCPLLVSFGNSHPYLEYLDCHGCHSWEGAATGQCTYIDVRDCPKLKGITAGNNTQTFLHDNNYPELTSITVLPKSLKISPIDFTNLPLLESIHFENDFISEIDLTKCPLITSLELQLSSLDTIDILNLGKLKNLRLTLPKITVLDLSGIEDTFNCNIYVSECVNVQTLYLPIKYKEPAPGYGIRHYFPKNAKIEKK